MRHLIPLVMTLGCARAGDASTLPTGTLQVDGHALTVEVADDDAERARGLMFRDAMADDHGMIFVYTDDELRSFWMKDTRIPLSIAYIDYSGKILHIADMRPHDKTGVSSRFPVRYCLEVNQGWFAAHDVAVGDMVTGFKELPKSAK